MLLNNLVRNDVIIDGEQGESRKMHLAVGAEAHLIRMLTRAYSDPIGSLIREAAANSVDSLRMAGKEETSIIRLKKEGTGNWIFEAEDEGLGLDKEDFYKYIMGVGESNKRGLPGVIGGYGIGSKASISYTNNFYYLCRKDGMERKFMIFEGEQQPEAEMLYEMLTDKPNGVTITVPIKYGDNYVFENKIKEQLAYFEKVYFDIPNFNNSFKIFREKDFQWSELNRDSYMHISMDNVYYPIDWGKLGIPNIHIPIALRFSLTDGLLPIPNREQLEYTKDTKALILNKIKIVSQWFIERYNSEVKEFDTLLEALPFINTSNKNISIEGKNFEISYLEQYSDVKFAEPIVKGIKLKSPVYYKQKKDAFIDEYSAIAYDDYNSMWKKKNISWEFSFSKLEGKNKIILFNGESLAGNVKEFLRDKHGRSTVYIEKNRTRKLNGGYHFEGYKSLLLLTDENKTEWRELIKEWQYIQKTITDKFIDETNVENTKEYQNWLQEKKEEQKNNREKGIYKGKYLNKQEGDITMAYSRLSALDGKAVVFEKKAYPIKDLYKNKFLTLYWEDTPENKVRASMYHHLTTPFKLKIALIGKRELTKLPDNHNFMTENNYQKTNQFRKFCTAIKAKEIMDVYDAIGVTHQSLIKEILSKHYEDVERLRKYYQKNYSSYVPAELRSDMMNIATTHKLFDEEEMVIIRRVERDIKRFDFLSILKVPSQWDEMAKKKYNKLVNQMLLFRKLYENSFSDFEIVESTPIEIQMASFGISEEGKLDCGECEEIFTNELEEEVA